jgi:hypothetical protein
MSSSSVSQFCGFWVTPKPRRVHNTVKTRKLDYPSHLQRLQEAKTYPSFIAFNFSYEATEVVEACDNEVQLDDKQIVAELWEAERGEKLCDKVLLQRDKKRLAKKARRAEVKLVREWEQLMFA